MTQEEAVKKYQPLLKDLFEFMVQKKYTCKPYPKVILDLTDQGDDVLCYTAYYDPEAKAIRLFIHDRLCKDVLRSFAHECIHHRQREDGTISKSNYKGDKITEDANLVKLEEEAYLNGNMAFRSWTENKQKEQGNK